MVFEEYAQYYDLLYADKDYVGEAKYIDSLVKKYEGESRCSTLLELGSGTGKHAVLLSEMGYKVCGVERSEQMIRQAMGRTSGTENPCFMRADIRNFSFEKKFDVAISLFHVMSYLKDLDDFCLVLKNVFLHLNENGVFIFDTWYGPAVLTEKPELRVKRLENQSVEITRIAEPVMRENENIVDVNYDIFVKNKDRETIKELCETHSMRYYFLPEMKQCLKACGFMLIDSFEFITGRELSKENWSSCFVAIKN